MDELVAFKLKEVAEILNCGVGRVRTLIRTGQLIPFYLSEKRGTGADIRVSQAELSRFMEGAGVRAAPPMAKPKPKSTVKLNFPFRRPS